MSGEAPIRLAVPDVSDADIAAVSRVLRSGFLVQGAEVAAFEGAFAAYTGAEHAVAVSNCTAALHMALLALGIGPGDRVLVTTYSWPATANAILLVGATPVFVDIEDETFAMDPDHFVRAYEGLSVSDRATVKAVVVVHPFGLLAKIERIVEIAARYNLRVVEDAACALGAQAQGKHAGTFGDIGCFSFHPRKALTTGEGGMLTTRSADLSRTLRMLRNHGLDPDATSPTFVLAGFNYRMTEFQAAMGRSQLERFGMMLATRREKVAAYLALFGTLDARKLVQLPDLSERHTHQSFVVVLPKSAVRAQVLAHLKAQGIEATIGTYAMPDIGTFKNRGFSLAAYPVTSAMAERALTLPLHKDLSPADQARIVRALLGACTA